jgi:hypothetical protein
VCSEGVLSLSSFFSRPLSTVVEIAQLALSPDNAIRTDAVFLFRILGALSTGAKEPAVEVVLVIRRASATVADAQAEVIVSVRNLHVTYAAL